LAGKAIVEGAFLDYSQLINNLNKPVEILYQRETGLQEEKNELKINPDA